MSTIDQQFVEFVVKALVNNTDAVKVEREIDERGVLLSLTVDPEDVGRVIGKRGATAQSIRTLLRVLGTKNGARYNLKIVNTDDFNPNEHKTASDNSDDSVTDESDAPVDPDNAIMEEPESELAEKTRAELADLDDLEI